MKHNIFIYTLYIISCLAYSQSFAQSKHSNLKLETEKTGANAYTFSDAKDTSALHVTLSKEIWASQLTALNANTAWIGKTNPYVRHSDIVVTLSQPVTSISIFLSEFNNDGTDEQVGKFKIYDENENNTTANVSFQWLTGEASGDPISNEKATEFDPIKHTIKATYGNCCASSSGRIVLSSTVPFTKITFRYEILEGTPNGFYFSGDITYTPAKPPVIVKPVADLIDSTYSLPSLISKDTLLPSTPIVLASKPIDSTVQEKVIIKKDPIKKPATVVASKSSKVIPKKRVADKVPLKNTTTKTVPTRALVKTVPTKKIVPNKTIAKPSVKKTIPTKVVAKKEVKKVAVPEKAHDIKEVKTIQVGETVKLNHVFFKQGLPELLPNSYPQLDTLVMIMKENKTLEIELQGHTDNQGDARINLQLSEQRVVVVRQYLISKGIVASRLTEKGFGGSRPAVPNDTEENRKKNRRVEFMITKR